MSDDVPTDTDCTEACYAQPTCVRCKKTKAPRGRSVAMEAASSYCCGSGDCPGYYEEPRAGHLWPGEPGDPSPTSPSQARSGR